MLLSLLICNFETVATFLPYSASEVNSFLRKLIDKKKLHFQLTNRCKFIFDQFEFNETTIIFLFQSCIEHHHDIVNELLKCYPGILIDGYNIIPNDERQTLVLWSKKTLYSLLTLKSLNIFEAEQYLKTGQQDGNIDFFFPPELLPSANKIIGEKLFKMRDLRRTKLPSLTKRKLETIAENDD